MYFMDFRNLDEHGEPAIVLVDVEMDPEGEIKPVAKNLREFIEKVLYDSKTGKWGEERLNEYYG